MARTKRIADPDVAAIFRDYPKQIRSKLLQLRQLIFDVAAKTDGVGELQETLKWGQPSYLTTLSKAGSTIRIDQVKSQPGRYAMYFHCQTTLVGTFRQMFRDRLTFEGNRGIVFKAADRLPARELRHCIALALTYHRNNRPRNRVPARRAKSTARRSPR